MEERRLLTITPVPQPLALSEGANDSVQVATFVDTDNVGTGNFSNVSINWGDNTTTAGTVAAVTGNANAFTVTGSHAYAEEGARQVTVSLHDGANNVDVALPANAAVVADAALAAGNPVTAGTPAEFSGTGGTQAAGGAANALANFQAAIGGANNQGISSPQTNGFRVINWDGVKLDGTDFGGSSTVIDAGKTVAIPLNRFQERGIFFNAEYAVSGDGFASVDPAATGLFPAFSPTKTFAMFNDNGIDWHFVLPSDHGKTPQNAATTGFGAIFLNVQTPNTTSIEYFHGAQSLGKFFVPVGTAGQPEFLGELFNQSIVTGVVLTLGTDVLFSFDGTTFSASGATDTPPTHNLVATDDFVYPEPVAQSDLPVITGTQGQAFSGKVATFNEADPSANAKDFFASIDWGDGNSSPGTITANGQGGFDVSGTNTFARGGTLPVTVHVQDLGGSLIDLPNTAQVTPVVAFPLDKAKAINVRATAGTAFSGAVLTFRSLDPNASASDFVANINWGDGHVTAGTITAGKGGFVVSGTNTFASAGTFKVAVAVQSVAGATTGNFGTAKVKAAHGRHLLAHVLPRLVNLM